MRMHMHAYMLLPSSSYTEKDTVEEMCGCVCVFSVVCVYVQLLGFGFFYCK